MTYEESFQAFLDSEVDIREYSQNLGTVGFVNEVRRELAFNEITVPQALKQLEYRKKRTRLEFYENCFKAGWSKKGYENIDDPSNLMLIDGKQYLIKPKDEWTEGDNLDTIPKCEKEEYEKLEKLAFAEFDALIAELEAPVGGQIQLAGTSDSDVSKKLAPIIWHWGISDLGRLYEDLHNMSAISCGPKAFAALFVQKTGAVMPSDLSSYVKGQASKNPAMGEIHTLLKKRRDSSD